MDERLFFLNNPWRSGTYRLSDDIIERDMFALPTPVWMTGKYCYLPGCGRPARAHFRQLIHHLLTVRKTAPTTVFHFTFDDLSLRHDLSASLFEEEFRN